MKQTEPQARLYPMKKREGFIPAVQRYSAVHPDNVSTLSVVYLGVQSTSNNRRIQEDFIEQATRLFSGDAAPVLFDFAHYKDPDSYNTTLAVAYWYGEEAAAQWRSSEVVEQWWNDPAKDNLPVGYFRESFTASIDHAETILFKELARGLSACPMSKVEPMGESGYWGGARDRIPASAYDLLETPHKEPLAPVADCQSFGKRLCVEPPANMVLIRSGASWSECGSEQLQSYQQNLKPVLDEGMEYLRQNPIDTGCCCLRQLDSLDLQGQPLSENYCAGYFLSMEHLETWAMEHPTHLAIYGQAQRERTKYKEKLELRTYHEIYVIDRESSFEYINCHPNTGLLPWFETSKN